MLLHFVMSCVIPWRRLGSSTGRPVNKTLFFAVQRISIKKKDMIEIVFAVGSLRFLANDSKFYSEKKKKKNSRGTKTFVFATRPKSSIEKVFH